mgnify:FL=1
MDAVGAGAYVGNVPRILSFKPVTKGAGAYVGNVVSAVNVVNAANVVGTVNVANVVVVFIASVVSFRNKCCVFYSICFRFHYF